MHLTFIPYGGRQFVETLLRDMEAQKFMLKMSKAGEPDKAIWINGVVRLLPMGVYDYIFPKEYRDVVLHTLVHGKEPNRFKVPKVITEMFRLGLKLKSLPKEHGKERLLWQSEHVHIIAIGLREDSIITEPKGKEYEGWIHEAL